MEVLNAARQGRPIRVQRAVRKRRSRDRGQYDQGVFTEDSSCGSASIMLVSTSIGPPLSRSRYRRDQQILRRSTVLIGIL